MPKGVSSSFSGPNIEWYTPPKPKKPELIKWATPIVKKSYVLIISPPGPTPKDKEAKWGSKINPCSYIGFSLIKWETSKSDMDFAQNIISPVCAMCAPRNFPLRLINLPFPDHQVYLDPIKVFFANVFDFNCRVSPNLYYFILRHLGSINEVNCVNLVMGVSIKLNIFHRYWCIKYDLSWVIYYFKY